MAWCYYKDLRRKIGARLRVRGLPDTITRVVPNTADPDKLEKAVAALMDYLSWGGHPAPLKRLNRALRGLPPAKRDGETTPNPAWPR